MINKIRFLIELFSSKLLVRFCYFINLFFPLYHFNTSFSKIYNYYIRSFEKYNHLLNTNLRLNMIKLYIFNALNCIFKACKLISLGFHIESSHNNRHFIESISLALLCSNKSIQVFERIKADMVNFPYHNALEMLRKPVNSKRLSLIVNGTNILKNVYSFMNNFSHASMLSLGYLYNFSKKHKVSLGPFYDKAKKAVYKKQIILYISGCNVLKDVIDVIFHNLKKDNLL